MIESDGSRRRARLVASGRAAGKPALAICAPPGGRVSNVLTPPEGAHFLSRVLRATAMVDARLASEASYVQLRSFSPRLP